MNDRFKLRAFYKGKMYPVGAIFYKMEKVKIGKHLVKIDELDSPLMQATGNRDIAEAPIYEGDISKNGLVVYWSKNYNGFRLLKMETLESFTLIPEYVEIIGNIHENKNLWKVGIGIEINPANMFSFIKYRDKLSWKIKAVNNEA